MKIGVMLGADRQAQTIDDIVATAVQVENAGLDAVWMANIRAHDAITTLSIVGRETSTIALGTAVTPTYPRHPIAMAQQALTAAAATQGRFTLGIGLSHKVVIEGMYGLSYAQPARHMREYLDVLAPLLRGETVNYRGEQYCVNDIAIEIPDHAQVGLVVAALGPRMLDLAGRLSDGTNTWMVGPKTMAEHIVKRLSDAARDAGRARPRVVGGYPVAVTDNPSAVRAAIAEPLAIYGQLPSYRAMLDREGLNSPVDIAIVGDEQTVSAALERTRESGVTEFMAAIFDAEPGAYSRTLALLSSVLV